MDDILRRYNERLKTFEPDVGHRPIIVLLSIIAEELAQMNRHLALVVEALEREEGE